MFSCPVVRSRCLRWLYALSRITVLVAVGVFNASAFSAEWISLGSGDWETPSNWDIGAIPNGTETTFGTSIVTNATITLDRSRSVTNLSFNNSNSYVLAGNPLTITGDTMIVNGSHTIADGVTFAPGTRMLNAAAGAELTIGGPIRTVQNDVATLILAGGGDGTVGALMDANDDGMFNIEVVKRGRGTWTIGDGSNVFFNFHTGDTTIEEGRLRVKADVAGGTIGELRTPEIFVRSGATFDTSDFSTYSLQLNQNLQGSGTIDAGGNTFQVFSDNLIRPGDGVGTLSVDGDLSLFGVEGDSPTGGIQFQLSSSTTGGNDRVVVDGNLISNAGGGGQLTRIGVVPTATSLATGSYELIRFSGSHIGSVSDFSLDSALATRFSQAITADSDSINLQITGSNAALSWRGNDSTNPNVWDVNGVRNWNNSGTSDVYFDLDGVRFDDSAVSTNIQIQGTVTPASTTFSNSTKDYVVSGESIAGAGGFTKTGSGSVTLNQSNTYSGLTAITGGVLHAANDGALGSTDSGTIVSGGTLDITGSNIAGETVSIQGNGNERRGALITSGPDKAGGGTQQISDVIQTGDAAIGAYFDGVGDQFDANDYRWDLEPSGIAGVATWEGNGHNLTKKGRGTVSIQRTGEMNVPTINIEEGILFLQGSTTSTGATVAIGNGVPLRDNYTGNASLSFFYSNTTGPAPNGGMHSMNLVLNGGEVDFGSALAGDLTLAGSVLSINVSGDSSIDNSITSSSANRRLKLPQGITGSGDLRFSGEGIVELQSNNTYSGRTEVTGNLALTGSARLSNTPQIDVIGNSASPATLDVTGRSDGTITLINQSLSVVGGGQVTGNVNVAAGAQLTGAKSLTENLAARILGNVLVQSGGTLVIDSGLGIAMDPDPAPKLTIGIEGDLTLDPNGTLAIDLRSLDDFDNLTVSGEANLGGTVSVTLDGFTPNLNDTFLIMNAGALIDNGLTLGGPDGSEFTLGMSGNNLTLTFGMAMANGDFDGNGMYDCVDIDALVSAIVAGSGNPSFDLDGNGMLDTADVQAWLIEAGEVNLGAGRAFLRGDATLDGVVDVSDFAVWNANKFTSTGAWCQGDFTADGVTDVSDFAVWNANKFTSSDAAVVPEPATTLGLIVGFTLLGCLRRRVGRKLATQ